MIRNFDPSNMPLRGRALLWKFNNSLLDDQFFCTNMTLFINDLPVRVMVTVHNEIFLVNVKGEY